MPWSRKNTFKQKIKAVPIKAKMNKLNYIKMKNLCFSKDTLKKVTEQVME